MTYEYISFRARVNTEEDFWTVKNFCAKHNITPSAFFNSILPAAAHCLNNYTTINENGEPVVELNLGAVTIK